MSSTDSRKKELVRSVIRQLHQGLPVEKAREQILREVGKLTSLEITDIEQSLIDEGVSPDEIKRFCNVHALLFEDALENVVRDPDSPSHPLALLTRENREIEKVVATVKAAVQRGDSAAVTARLKALAGLDRHYSLKENALFPSLEKHGFPGPSKVMWSKHDEVRGMLKKVLASETPAAADVDSLLAEVAGMVFKEESILFPAARERIPAQEWMAISKAFDEIGFPFISGHPLHDALQDAEKSEMSVSGEGAATADEIVLPSGRLSAEELAAMLNTMPLDVTFVDANDKVKYFSQSPERIFVRATSILGRDVKNCHPPQSVHKVARIVDSFKDGTRDHADFWIRLQGKLVHIRYFAVRNKEGKYLGTLEMTQDITGIQSLEGERRLLDD
jgi:PAS domain S-box-containing protein